jgi:hypothetical protein
MCYFVANTVGAPASRRDITWAAYSGRMALQHVWTGADRYSPTVRYLNMFWVCTPPLYYV